MKDIFLPSLIFLAIVVVAQAVNIHSLRTKRQIINPNQLPINSGSLNSEIEVTGMRVLEKEEAVLDKTNHKLDIEIELLSKQLQYFAEMHSDSEGHGNRPLPLTQGSQQSLVHWSTVILSLVAILIMRLHTTV